MRQVDVLKVIVNVEEYKKKEHAFRMGWLSLTFILVAVLSTTLHSSSSSTRICIGGKG